MVSTCRTALAAHVPRAHVTHHVAALSCVLCSEVPLRPCACEAGGRPVSLRRGEGERKGAQSAQRAMSASRRRVYAELLEDEYGNKVDARFLPHLSAKPGAFCPCPPVRLPTTTLPASLPLRQPVRAALTAASLRARRRASQSGGARSSPVLRWCALSFPRGTLAGRPHAHRPAQGNTQGDGAPLLARARTYASVDKGGRLSPLAS